MSCSGTDSEVEEVSRRVVSLSVADVLSVAKSPSFSLPTFIPAQDPVFEWGFLSGQDTIFQLDSAYEAI